MSDSETLIRCVALSRHYGEGESRVTALDAIDLEVKAGEFLMIVGASGSGKSTLLQLLGLLDGPSSGRLELAGIDMAGASDDERSAARNGRLGFIFQSFHLLPQLNVLENIALPLTYRGVPRPERLERARAMAEKVGLGTRLHHRPTQLSGGQNQRVAIARALIGNPALILADEPTGALDSATGRDIMNFLQQLNAEGCTIVMVTHDRDLALQGTRRISMRDGKIVADEPGVKEARPASIPAPPSPGHIGLAELAAVGWREGLLPHKLRSLLTALGIIIGVAGAVSMGSFSLASKKKQADQVRALGSNLVKVVDSRLESERLVEARSAGSAGLSRRDLQSLRAAVPGVVASAVCREAFMNVLHEGRRLDARVIGVAGEILKVSNLSLGAGRPLSSADQDAAARVCVIGATLARQIGPDALGSTLHLSGMPCRVIGVLASRDVDLGGLEASGVRDANRDIMLPLSTVLARTTWNDQRSELDEIHLQLDHEDHMASAGLKVRRVMEAMHHGANDWQLFIPLDLLRQKEESQRLLDVLTFVISSISVLVGGIGIMNIMLASVNERIKEIGLRRAIGAPRDAVLRQFLLEAVMISLAGGILGLVLAGACVSLVCFTAGLPLVVSPLLVSCSFVAAASTGLIFGWWPARTAANLNPVEALRTE